jgi:type I restriction enzyme S subunit
MEKNRSKFKETEIGMIPENWEVTTVPYIASNFDNRRKPLSSAEREKMKGKYPYYGAAGIIDYINEFKYDGIYLLIAEDGTVTSDGSKPMLQLSKGKFWVSNHAHVLQCEYYEDTLFLYYQLKNTSITPFITGAVQPKLSQENLNKIKFAWTKNINERHAIAKILSDLDSKIELNHQTNKTLEIIGQAIFKHWFVDFEFPNDEGKPYKSSGGEMVYNEELGKEIPKGWEVGKIEDVAAEEKNAIVDGPFGTQMKIAEYQDSGIPIIEMEFLEGYPFYKPFKNFISEEKFQEVKRSSVKEGDIIISKTGTLGLLGIMTDIYNKAVLVSRLAKISVNENKIGRYYLFLLLKKLSQEKYWDRISSGSTMPIINLTHIKLRKIIIPDKYILSKFEILMKSIYIGIHNDLKEIQTLSQIRDALLPKLMSGKIRVPLEEKE